MDGFVTLVLIGWLPGVFLAAVLGGGAWLAHGGSFGRYFRVWCLILGIVGLGAALALLQPCAVRDAALLVLLALNGVVLLGLWFVPLLGRLTGSTYPDAVREEDA